MADRVRGALWIAAFTAIWAGAVGPAAVANTSANGRAQAQFKSAEQSLNVGEAESPGTSSITGRCCVSMAYDPEYTNGSVTGMVILYGGRNATSVLQETWTWDGASWSQYVPIHSPPQLRSARMVWDPALHELVLFGG